MVDHLRAFRDDMCDCSDGRCAKQVDHAFAKWRSGHAKALATRPAPGDEEQRLDHELESCQARAEAAGPGSDPVFEKMKEFTVEMCGCADHADPECAKRVTDEMTKWAQTAADEVSPAMARNEEEIKITERFTDCATKAMMAGMPAAPPPPASPEPSGTAQARASSGG